MPSSATMPPTSRRRHDTRASRVLHGEIGRQPQQAPRRAVAVRAASRARARSTGSGRAAGEPGPGHSIRAASPQGLTRSHLDSTRIAQQGVLREGFCTLITVHRSCVRVSVMFFFFCTIHVQCVYTHWVPHCNAFFSSVAPGPALSRARQHAAYGTEYRYAMPKISYFVSRCRTYVLRTPHTITKL